MAQLLIQSRGVAPTESFTLLGASLSRNEDDLLGQFGSGAKLAITSQNNKPHPDIYQLGAEIHEVF